MENDFTRLVSPNFKDLLKPSIEIKKFPDGDSYIRVPQIRECAGRQVALFHRLYPKQNSAIIQSLFILEALREVGAEVTLVAPYLPYSRQDKIFLKGEVKSAEKICNLLVNVGCKRLVTLDCHFLKKAGKFDYGGLRITNITMSEALLAYARTKFGEPFEVISPDEGARYMVAARGGKTMQKVRGGYVSGEAGGTDVAYRTIEKLEGTFNFNGKNVLVLDDMISTGSTMRKAVENVKNSGAKRVACAATHGFFLKDSLAWLRRECDFVFVTNSIPSPVSEVNVIKELLRQL